ncbi:MAG: hypothetical protein K8R02_05880 [Anaerohalosphaeraceae bacterium]|nr:hypothetical protein [Anaerohalosphaeraceae bacterium]
MKEFDKTEELLNSYLDGELDERRSTEAKRLIDHDEDVRAKYETLEKYKSLVEALPCDKAPGNTFEEITHRLEREVLWDNSPESSYKAGRRHLFLRRLVTTAAVLFLAAGLFVIIFDVFVPESTRKQFVANFGRERQSQVLYERPFADAKMEPTVVEDVRVEPENSPIVPLSAKLVFKTSAPIQVDMFVGKAIMNRQLFAKTTAVVRKSSSIYYELECDKSDLISLIDDLAILWKKCQDVQMSVETEIFDNYVTIDRISASDVLEICQVQNYNQRMRMAEDISKINAVSPAAMVIEKLYAGGTDIDLNMFELPKPVLTEPEDVQAKTIEDPAKLTIIVQR